jgi:hypothetical protein
MEELLPGLLHWSTFHEGIGMEVHSHVYLPAGAVFDPLLPPGTHPGEMLRHAEPEVVLLSNRHHLRDARSIAEEFACSIRCHESGLHEFEGDDDVEGFAFGDEVATGVLALEVGALTPEDTAFRIEAGPGALLFADGLIRSGGELAFVPEYLMGDDPEAVAAGLHDALRRIAVREDYDALLFAHGDPLTSGGRDALRSFAGA